MRTCWRCWRALLRLPAPFTRFQHFSTSQGPGVPWMTLLWLGCTPCTSQHVTTLQNHPTLCKLNSIDLHHTSSYRLQMLAVLGAYVARCLHGEEFTHTVEYIHLHSYGLRLRYILSYPIYIFLYIFIYHVQYHMMYNVDLRIQMTNTHLCYLYCVLHHIVNYVFCVRVCSIL